MRAGHPDGAEDRDTVHDDDATGGRQDAAVVGDGEASQPGLPRLSRQLRGGHVKGGGRVGLVEGQLRRMRLGAIHPSDGDGTPRFIHDGGRDLDPRRLRVGVRSVDHVPRGLHGDRLDGGLVLAKEDGVHLDGGRVFGGDIDVLEDGIDRADDLALLAVDTHVGIDVELPRPRRRVDAGDRAHLDARSVVGTESRDDVGHARRSGTSVRSASG